MSVNQSEDGTPTNTQAIATVTAAAAVAASSQFQRLKVSLEDVTVLLLYRSYWGNLASFFFATSLMRIYIRKYMYKSRIV